MDTEQIIALVVGISLVTCIVLVVFILSKYNYLLKKAIIERGAEYELPRNQYRYLELGCVIIGLGIGLGISSVFTFMDLSGDAMDLLVWATILICGGGGLVVAYMIRRKQESEL